LQARERKDEAGEMAEEVDWFSEHAATWERVLLPKCAKARHALMIGPYDGRCLRWLFDRVLTAPGSRATVVDDFKYPACVSMRGKAVRYPARSVEATFETRLSDVRSRVRVIKKPPYEALTGAAGRNTAYDLVYIDATGSRMAMETAVLAFRRMAPGGVAIITNNTHNDRHDAVCPRRGIDGFLDAYAFEIKVLRQGFHVFFEKRKTPLRTEHCNSEYFGREPLPRCGPRKTR
jgi:hypothetical protein